MHLHSSIIVSHQPCSVLLLGSTSLASRYWVWLLQTCWKRHSLLNRQSPWYLLYFRHGCCSFWLLRGVPPVLPATVVSWSGTGNLLMSGRAPGTLGPPVQFLPSEALRIQAGLCLRPGLIWISNCLLPEILVVYHPGWPLVLLAHASNKGLVAHQVCQSPWLMGCQHCYSA